MIPTHLNWAQRRALWHILKKHSILFSGKLGKLPCKPVHLKLTDPNAKPYHGKLYQVPCLLLPLLKKKSKDCVRLESFARQTIPNGPHKALPYLKRTNRSDSSLIFACWTDSYTDTHFRYLRFKKLCIQSMDLPCFISVLDLNMGFWMIQLDKESQRLATVILPWGKYSY
jgi:hypothetical protein